MVHVDEGLEHADQVNPSQVWRQLRDALNRNQPHQYFLDGRHWQSALAKSL